MIKNSVDPVNIQSTEKILNQMKNCVCKIKIGKINATGFFCKVPFINMIFLMTNFHVINEEYTKKNKEIHILLNDEKEAKRIDLTIKREKYFNEAYDIALIELKEKDKIKDYLELDDNIFKDDEQLYFEQKSIYILHYLYGNDICVSYGLLNRINKYDIMHACSTDNGSSGSPILNLKNNKVIGIHKEGSTKFNYNKGTLLKYPLNDIIKKFNKNENNNNIIINKNKNNIIIGEINIKKEDINEDIQIINSFENIKRKYPYSYFENEDEYKNEKEIKENIEIKINEKIIEFTYNYKFKKEGKSKIEYLFKNNLTNICCMFYDCESLTNLNLSNCNTQNITNMKEMFLGCKSLTNLNLSNFNTQNAINMDGMFAYCNSLSNLDLSNFNTQNVTNMKYMFCGCNSLSNLDLSNFNTQNVTNMEFMFHRCNSLTNLNLSNFNTQNVTDMSGMFYYCDSLTKENLITKDNEILEEYENK